MFTPEQYREKAAEYSELAKQANAPNEVREFQRHEQSFTMLADNEQWLADNHDNLAINLDKLARIMHDVAHFCTSARRTRAAGRSAWTGLLPLAVQRVWG
jgi:hypothetical protein